MSFLRKSLDLDRAGIKRLTNFDAKDGTGLQVWLDKLVVTLQDNYKLQRDAIVGSTLAETPLWVIREATAADVTAGNSRLVGNLIVIEKATGTKREFEQT